MKIGILFLTLSKKNWQTAFHIPFKRHTLSKLLTTMRTTTTFVKPFTFQQLNMSSSWQLSALTLSRSLTYALTEATADNELYTAAWMSVQHELANQKWDIHCFFYAFVETWAKHVLFVKCFS